MSPRLTLVHIANTLGPYPALISDHGWLGWVQEPAFDRDVVERILSDLKAAGVPLALFDSEDNTIHVQLPREDFPSIFKVRNDGRFVVGPSWKWEEFRPPGTEADPPVRACHPDEIRPVLESLLQQTDPALILLVLADIAEERMLRAVTVSDSNRWAHVAAQTRTLAMGVPHFDAHRHFFIRTKRRGR